MCASTKALCVTCPHIRLEQCSCEQASFPGLFEKLILGMRLALHIPISHKHWVRSRFKGQSITEQFREMICGAVYFSRRWESMSRMLSSLSFTLFSQYAICSCGGRTKHQLTRALLSAQYVQHTNNGRLQMCTSDVLLFCLASREIHVAGIRLRPLGNVAM